MHNSTRTPARGCQVLSRHVLPGPGTAAKAFPLRAYADAGVGSLRVFMRKERTPVREGGKVGVEGKAGMRKERTPVRQGGGERVLRGGWVGVALRRAGSAQAACLFASRAAAARLLLESTCEPAVLALLVS